LARSLCASAIASSLGNACSRTSRKSCVSAGAVPDDEIATVNGGRHTTAGVGTRVRWIVHGGDEVTVSLGRTGDASLH
jgi:hypothetical protein